MRLSFPKKGNGIFIFILFLQILNMLYWGNMKSGFYWDEFFTFERAHYISASTPDRVKLYESNLWEYKKWFEVKGMRDAAMAVEPEYSLWKDSIQYRIQIFFSHKPYMSLLNYIEALFFPGEVNKWSGILINIVLFAANQIVMFCLVTKLTGRKTAALLSVIIYGFSGMAISMVEFVRFYTWVTFLVLLFTYFHFCMLKKQNWKINLLYELFALVSIYLAFLDSELVVLYAVPFILLYLAMLMINKRYKQVLYYSVPTVGGVFTYLLLKTNLIQALFHRDRFTGIEAGDAMRSLISNWITLNSVDEIIFRVKEFGKIICDYLFGHFFVALAYVVIIFLLIFSINIRHKEKWYGLNKEIRDNKIFFMVVVVSVFIYSVAAICFRLGVIRYVSCIFPQMAIVLGILISFLMERNQNSNLVALAISLVVVSEVIITLSVPRIENLYLESREQVAQIKSYQNIDSVVIDYGYDGTVMYDCLATVDMNTEAMVVKYDDLDSIEWRETILVWQSVSKENVVLEELSKCGYQSIEKIGDTNLSSVFLCKK